MGNSIYRLRRNFKLSQAELAEKCKVSQQFIQMVEQGKRTPSIGTAIKLADALGVTIDELLKGEPQCPKSC